MTVLDQSLCLLDGVTPKAEIRLRRRGVLSCRQLAYEAERHFSRMHAARVRESFAEMCNAASYGLADWFVNHLPVGHRVRALLHYLPQVTFYDIETDGLSAGSQITCITTYNAGRFKSFVRGRNLEDFLEVWSSTKILVGFNSKRFDTPAVCRLFCLSSIPAQVDIMDEARHFGYHGGLKAIEREIGVSRNRAKNMDGRDAIRLWKAYADTGCGDLLEELLAYNLEDVRSLWYLSALLARRSLENTHIDIGWPNLVL